jgi:hypothetical protein
MPLTKLTRWVMRHYNERRRRIDMEILWPQCLAGARDLEHAKMAFALHCHNDPAWRVLGREGINEFIRKLETYD